MSTGALLFMTLSWAFVIGLMTWSFARILKKQRHFDPDGTGPAQPPEPPAAEAPRGGSTPPRQPR